MNSAFFKLVSGQMPATIGMRNPSIARRKFSSSRRSKTGCVIPNSAPASTLCANRRISCSMSGTPGLAATESVNSVGAPSGLPPMSSPWFSARTIRVSPIASTSNTAVASG